MNNTTHGSSSQDDGTGGASVAGATVIEEDQNRKEKKLIDTLSIPDYLKNRKQWLLWRFESRGTKPTKVPCQANGTTAKSNDRSTWTDFLTCQNAFDAGGFDGIGFAFDDGDGLCGIDLDYCIDLDGQIAPWAQNIVDHFGTAYIERSPSGRGLHIWCLGQLIKTGHKKWTDADTGAVQGMEVYNWTSPRYLTVTGDAIQIQKISNCQSGLDWLHVEYYVDHYEVPIQGRCSDGQPDLELVRTALEYIDADEYEIWLRVGMALSAGGLDESLWDEWSSKSIKYEAGECQKKWSTFSGNRIGLGTIFHLAGQNGFRFRGFLNGKDIRESPSRTSLPVPWPVLLDKALYGVVGEIVRAATLDSEADPAAVLMTTLVRAGATFGAQNYVNVGETRHPARLMAAVVGASSRARKGTSTNPVSRIFEEAEILSDKPKLQVSNGPLSSGEGLIYAVRDPSEKLDKDGVPEDPGTTDKRLLVIEGELGAPLKAMQRDGNTLSAIIRTAWDSGCIAPLTKSNRIKTTGAHISILGHITRNELASLLQTREVWNGLANRFVWVCARRTRTVAFPRPMPDDVVNAIAGKLSRSIDFAREITCVRLHPETVTMWEENYPLLSRDAPGVFGAVTARAEAQVMRISMIYALLDQSGMIQPEHLRAAMSVWQYCRDSARCIFGSAETAPEVSRIIRFLKAGEKTQTELNGLFSGHLGSEKLKTILGDLQAAGSIVQRTDGGGRGRGKSKTFWSLRSGFNNGLVDLDEFEE